MKRISTESKIVIGLIALSFIIGLIAFIFTGCTPQADSNTNTQNIEAEPAIVAIPEISTDEALELVDSNQLTIFDVRSESEYAGEHIKDAINLPKDSITEESAAAAIPNKDDYIAVYCQSGMRADAAAATLAQLGYTNIYDLGSIDDWTGEKVSE